MHSEVLRFPDELEDEFDPDVHTVATTPSLFMLVKKDAIISLTAPVRSTSRVCVCVDLIGEQEHCGLRMHDPIGLFHSSAGAMNVRPFHRPRSIHPQQEEAEPLCGAL